MTTLHQTAAGILSVTKGAPELLLQLSTHYKDGEQVRPLTSALRHQLIKEAENFAQDALRVLGVGYRLHPQMPVQDETLEHGLIFADWQFMDPPVKRHTPQ